MKPRRADRDTALTFRKGNQNDIRVSGWIIRPTALIVLMSQDFLFAILTSIDYTSNPLHPERLLRVRKNLEVSHFRRSSVARSAVLPRPIRWAPAALRSGRYAPEQAQRQVAAFRRFSPTAAIAATPPQLT
jgi:hypothetical protein